MVGAGMIFQDTYRPAFSALRHQPIYRRSTGPVEVNLVACASRTGAQARRIHADGDLGDFQIFQEPDSVDQLLANGVDVVCVATPDHRHYAAARAALAAGKHVLIEKPSVLSLTEWEDLVRLAKANQVLAKVVYHKLLDPDHAKLRTLVADGALGTVTSGYCSLLEPRSIARGQFAEWIAGRNPATYVAVHYIKLIDFTFGGQLRAVLAHGQRGQVGPAEGTTFDSVQLRLLYSQPHQTEVVFDIHTSWVTPDNFAGMVEQEVEFRFTNGLWHGHGRKRGVELTIEGRTPAEPKSTLNNHYSADILAPWGERRRLGYGVRVIERFFEEVAEVEFGGPPAERGARLEAIRSLAYNDMAADGPTVAAVQATEAILAEQAQGRPNAVARLEPSGALVLEWAGRSERRVLYPGGSAV